MTVTEDTVTVTETPKKRGRPPKMLDKEFLAEVDKL